MENTSAPKVYQAIANVTADISKVGVGKDRKNSAQDYQFRGIDDVYNALSPILAKNKLCILPRVTEHSIVERKTSSGKAIYYTTVKVEFDLVSAEDGSKHTIAMIGEAMDSADKSSNKAQSAAFKYAAMQAFCIPTIGNDSESTDYGDMQPAGMGEQQLAAWEVSIGNCKTPEEISALWKDIVKAVRATNNMDTYNLLKQKCEAHATILRAQQKAATKKTKADPAPAEGAAA